MSNKSAMIAIEEVAASTGLSAGMLRDLAGRYGAPIVSRDGVDWVPRDAIAAALRIEAEREPIPRQGVLGWLAALVEGEGGGGGASSRSRRSSDPHRRRRLHGSTRRMRSMRRRRG